MDMELYELAKKQYELHRKDGAMNKQKHKDPIKGAYIGLVGEKTFCLRYGLPMDILYRPRGDGGHDGVIKTKYGTFPWDAKAFSYPLCILAAKDVCAPNKIYVLGDYWEDDKRTVDSHEDWVELSGWQWGDVLLKTAPGDICRRGIVSYWLRRDKLRAMAELDEVVLKDQGLAREAAK